MEREASVNIIILDACRDNRWAQSGDARHPLQAVSSGLAPWSRRGTLIIFSTQPGNTASTSGRNSPFSAALLKHINAPGEDLPTILINVRNDVMAAPAAAGAWEHRAHHQGLLHAAEAAAICEPAPDQRMELPSGLGEGQHQSSRPALLPRAVPAAHLRAAGARADRAIREAAGGRAAARQEAAKQAEWSGSSSARGVARLRLPTIGVPRSMRTKRRSWPSLFVIAAQRFGSIFRRDRWRQAAQVSCG